MNCRIVLRDGTSYDVAASVKKKNGVTRVYLDRKLLPAECDYVDFLYDGYHSRACKGGFMFAPRGTKEGGTVLCNFRERDEDIEYISDSNYMPIFGFGTDERCVFSVVVGMRYDYRIVMGVKYGEYYVYPRFFVDAKNCVEDISIDLTVW